MTNAAVQLVDPIYKNHIHAIRCALSVSAKAMGHVAAKWQRDYQAGYRISSIGPDMSRAERFSQDCMTRHLLHSKLSREQWAILIVRYAPPLEAQGRPIADQSEIEEMQSALAALMSSIEHSVSKEFSGWCLLRWARRMPAGRGKWAEWEGRTNVSMPTLHRRCNHSIYKPMIAMEHGALERAKSILIEAALI